MSPRAKRTLGQRIIRELVLLVSAVVVAAITMTLVYQVIMHVVVPELTNGLASAPPPQGQEHRLEATSPMHGGTEIRRHKNEAHISVALWAPEYRGQS